MRKWIVLFSMGLGIGFMFALANEKDIPQTLPTSQVVSQDVSVSAEYGE